MSKPGAAFGEFQSDRSACLSDAGIRKWESDGPPWASFSTNFDMAVFFHCMKEKGYRPDANGYNAASFMPPRNWREVFAELKTP
jgi:hypothetical protein